MNTSPNPAQVMSTLRMLGDKELAQYASMHKTDPYIFPLAFQESNLRKQMRAQGAAGAAPQGPQPPVNDQALQAMAPPAQPPMPEDVGLGRIAPAGVAHMAGGGIVGFADGGSTDDPWVVQKIQEAAAYARQNGGDWARKLAEAGIDIASIPANKLQRMLAPISAQMGRAFGTETRIPGTLPQVAPEPRADEDYSNEGMRQPGPPAAAATAPNAPAQPAAPAAKPAAGLGALGMGGGTSMSLSQRGGAGAGGSGFKLETFTPKTFDPQVTWDQAMAGATKDPLAAERGAIADRERSDATQQLEDRKGLSAEQSKLYDKQAGRLDTREANLEKEGKRNEAMSWITAGLEMLQARGPGLAAIAGGAQKGFTQYAGGLEKLKAAQERIDEARDKVDEGRLGAKKEMVAAQGEYRAALTNAEKGIFAGLKEAYGWNREKAKLQVEMAQKGVQHENEIGMGLVNNRNSNMTSLQNNRESNATQLKVAQMHAANAGRNQQLEIFMALGKGDPIKGAQEYFSSQQGKTDPLGVIAKYRSSLPDMALTKGGLSKNSPPEDIMAAIMADIAAYSTRVQGAPAPIQAVGGAKVRP